MKQDIENIIRTNLPEKKEDDGFAQDPSVAFNNGFDEALSQINTSLIADEVLKMFREQIEDLPTLYNSIEHLISKDDILDLLDNLSPNKENKK